MTPKDREKFLEIVVGFAELKGKQLSAPALELYWRSMQDWTIEDFAHAAAHLVRACRFMPEPHDFDELRKAARPTPGEAWAKALAHCESGAWRRGGSSGDPRVDAAAAMVGGYERIALCETSKIGFIEHSFCEHLETLQDVTDTRQALPDLTEDERLIEQFVRRLA